jgi:hypothetical protein
MKRELPEVIKVEIQECLIKEEKEAAIEEDGFDPSDIADHQYKDWLENQYLKERKNGRKR